MLPGGTERRELAGIFDRRVSVFQEVAVERDQSCGLVDSIDGQIAPAEQCLRGRPSWLG